MNKICYIMGKSSSGKDTIFQRIVKDMPELKSVVLYTTRPIREGEKNGREYFFVSEEELLKYQEEGIVIELRAYTTIHGIWKYFTVDDGQIDLKKHSYVMIGTLESYEKMKEYFGSENMLPIYVEVEDGERLHRALLREQQQREPKYAEMCRRFLADSEDFSEEHLEKAGITNRYENKNMEECLEKIKKDICYINL